MGLICWLPLIENIENKGASNIIITNNGAVINNNGKIGSCYSFNGNDQYISLNGEQLFNCFSGGTTAFSICMWVYHADSRRAILFGDYGTSGSIGFNIELYTGHGVRFYWNGSPDYNTTLNVGASTWSHIAITYDGSLLKSYLNGNLVNTRTGTLATRSKTTGEFRLGRDSRTTDTALNGRLNDIRVYKDHALSAAEIKEISQGLVVHYKLDGMNPNYILNSSGVFLTNLGSAEGSRKEYKAKSLGQNLPIASGTTITISFDLYMEFNTANAYLYVYNTNNKGPHQTINGINALAGRTVAVGDIINERISVTGTITDRDSPTQTTDYIEFYSNYGSNNWYSISNIKLEIGRAATPYIPAGIEIDTTKIEDSSGYNHHAISNGSVTTTLDSDTPKYDCSTKFISGARIATPVASSTFLPTNAITVSIWYKSSSGTTRFLSCTESGGWNFEVSSSKASFPFYINGKGYGRIISTRNFYSDNKWHMITVTYDGISTGKWYWDGVLDNTITITSGWENLPIKYNANTPLTLGAEAQTIASPIAGTYVGNLSDLRIYCTALDADAIRQLYEVGAKIDNKNNIHAYEFNEFGTNQLTKSGVFKDTLNEETVSHAQVCDGNLYAENFIEA